MRGAGHVIWMGQMGSAYNILVGKPQGKRLLEGPRRRWNIILEWMLGI
jgi:hypothetical protein